jgi:hypothetical protein
MPDVIFTLSIAAFFLIAIGYMRFCERLKKGETKQ